MKSKSLELVRKFSMRKEQLIELIKKLLKTSLNLDFLLALEQKDIEALVVCIRDRLEKEK